MKTFDSYKSYFSFVFAREFAELKAGRPFHYEKGRLEKVGEVFSSPSLKPGDYVLRNIRNPLFITATVIFALALTTFLFYPTFVPAFLINATGVKLTAFLLTQSTILGLCMRTLGRLNNSRLIAAWEGKHIRPVHIGSIYMQIN